MNPFLKAILVMIFSTVLASGLIFYVYDSYSHDNQSQEEKEAPVPPEKEYIVGFNNVIDTNLIEGYGAIVIRQIPELKLVVIEATEKQSEELEKSDLIKHIEENGSVKAQ